MNFFSWTKKTMTVAVILAGLATGCSRSGRRQEHEHGETCGHGSAQEKPAQEHEHGEACGHGPAQEKPAQEHEHGEACDHGPAQEKPAQEHEHGEACGHGSEAPGAQAAFEIPENAQRLLGLSFVKAERRPVTGALRFPGRFEWMPGARRVYGVPAAGVVEPRVRPPQAVKAGDVLFTVRSPEWIARKGEVNEAEAARTLVKAEAEAVRRRLAQLKAAGTRHAELEQQLAVKEAEAVRAERTRQNAEAVLRAVRALCREEEDGVLVVRALEAGVVERLSAENGAWAETGAEVVCVTRVDGLWFRADGVASEMTNVRAGQKGFAEPPGKVRGEAAHGVIELGLAQDDAARVQPLYLLPQALPAWAGPGRAGVLNVIVAESAPASLALPQGCVVTDGLRRVVFVRDEKDPDRFLKVDVTLGAGDGDWVEVQGIEAGASVVLDGAYELKLASPAEGGQKKAAGHFHADGQFHEGKH